MNTRKSIFSYTVLVAVMLVFWLMSAQAEAFSYHYHYVSLNDKLPSGSYFTATGINDSIQVSGTLNSCDTVGTCSSSVAIYEKNGTMKVLKAGVGGSINKNGTIGGGVIINSDPYNRNYQAALFHKNKVKIIPLQPGGQSSSVIAFNESDTALVSQLNADTSQRTLLYKDGKASVLNFNAVFQQLPVESALTGINNQGFLSGTAQITANDVRGFRLNSHIGKAELLEPALLDTYTRATGINNRGNVFGYSSAAESPSGGRPYTHFVMWDREGHIQTYYQSQDIRSSSIVFNDKNQVVVTTRTYCDCYESYLVPAPGIVLNVRNLVENYPENAGSYFLRIRGINNNGDMIGPNFLLQRIDGAWGKRFEKGHPKKM
jgi:uncharacterized membrane protein